jgi:hypothetical protein
VFAKGNLHASGVKLVNYVLSAERHDECVELGGARGFDFFSSDPREAARLMQRLADASTRCEKPWFHTQTRLPADERLTPEQWEVVRTREEKRLGFSDLPCIWSFHVNEVTGERHMHAAWFRVDVEQERAVDPGLFKLRLKETCRGLEREFGLRELDNHRQPHDRARAADRNEVEEARRLGIDVRAIRNSILDCYQHADNGRAFRAAIEEKGFILANGDRRDCVLVIDQAGGHHALNKKLTGHTLEETRSRFADLDRSQLLSVEQAQATQRDRQAEQAMREARAAAKGRIDDIRPQGELGRHDELRAAEHDLFRSQAVGAGESPPEIAKQFGATAAGVTEQAVPVWDRDAANRAADEKIIDAAIRQAAPAVPEARQRQEPEAGAEARGSAAQAAQAAQQQASDYGIAAAEQPIPPPRELTPEPEQGLRSVEGFGDRILGSVGRVFSALLDFAANMIAPPPRPTPDQAERMARSAEERQEARGEQEAQAQRDEQHWLIIEALKKAREREEAESEQERASRRERDRGYERER